MVTCDGRLVNLAPNLSNNRRWILWPTSCGLGIQTWTFAKDVRMGWKTRNGFTYGNAWSILTVRHWLIRYKFYAFTTAKLCEYITIYSWFLIWYSWSKRYILNDSTWHEKKIGNLRHPKLSACLLSCHQALRHDRSGTWTAWLRSYGWEWRRVSQKGGLKQIRSMNACIHLCNPLGVFQIKNPS